MHSLLLPWQDNLDRDLQKHSTPYSRGKLLIAEKNTTHESQPPLNDTNNIPLNIYPHENTTTATDFTKKLKLGFYMYFAQIKIFIYWEGNYKELLCIICISESPVGNIKQKWIIPHFKITRNHS